MKVENDKNNEEILKVNRALESDKKSNAKKFEELSEHDSKFGQELLHQKVRYCKITNEPIRSVVTFGSSQSGVLLHKLCHMICTAFYKVLRLFNC